MAEPVGRVHRLRLYEDRDRSGIYSLRDLVRHDRGGEPALQGLMADSVITIERCCLDFDGGAPEDDGLLFIGVPPDRVLLAAIYETGFQGRAAPSPSVGWPLR